MIFLYDVKTFFLKNISPYLLTALLILTANVHADTSTLSATESVERWDIFELTLTLNTSKKNASYNPFIDTRISASLSNGHKSISVEGFYDGKDEQKRDIYKIRFMPDTLGNWTYLTKSNRWELTEKSGNFSVTKATKSNHGPVSVANTFHFAYADGLAYKPFGTTSYSWTHRPEKVEQQTLQSLAKSPFNKIRMCVFPQTHGTNTMPPQRFPFAGKPTAPDYTRFNPAFFQHLEKRIAQLRDLNIEADLILFHPYDDQHIWGLDNMPTEVDERYLRYIIARVGAYRNVWWSLANEYDFIRTKSESDWDNLFNVVVKADPYNHLRSIHNGKIIYNHNQPWVTHASIQNGSAVTSPTSAELYRDVYRKPIVYDEVEYEGNSESRWGQLSGKEMVHRFWSGTVAGTYVGHGEFIAEANDPGVVVWVGQGDKLKGESPERIAFLRQIAENGPSDGINPTDKWWTPNTGGKVGEYYLLYLGKDKATQWPFQLNKTGLEDGMKFRVDVIDTWDMTITPVDGIFEIVRNDKYNFTDTQHRSITLPGKEGMALRIMRIYE